MRRDEDPDRVPVGCGCGCSGAPREVGRIQVDRDALRHALGGRMEVVEALEAKAAGRPGVNVGRMWAFMAQAVYASGDLPVIATRECLQNS